MTLIQESEIIDIIFKQFVAGEGRSDADISITGSTQLVRDLGFSSVEFVVIFEKIQALRTERINFIDLIMPDRSTYVDDLSINQIFQFLNYSPTTQISKSQADPYAEQRDVIQKDDIDLLNQAIRHQT